MEVTITPTRLCDFFFSDSRVSDIFHGEETDFAFEFSEDLERTSLSADELFHAGVIRPLEAMKRPPKPSSPAKTSPSPSSRKWRLRDFLLFRSASEKDPLRKYVRSSPEAIGRRRRSPHEVHYVANRALSEEMKKKTFLPFKQGILGI